MLRIGIVGLGKMGLSHLSILGANKKVEVLAVCDTSGYLLSLLNKYTGVTPYSDVEEMLKRETLDAVVIATPSFMHARMVRAALEAGVHVFCEKPFCLDPDESRELVQSAEDKGLVTQVGYHNRFVGAFEEVRKLLEVDSIGKISHVTAEAYGPVVLKPKGGTWRSRQTDGGGCLYDYAAHPLNLVNWYFGEPTSVRGSVLGKIFSKETDDEVYSSLGWSDGKTGHLSVNWSDDSQRKMTTKITIWGAAGKIYADRQECQVYLRDSANVPDGYKTGWNIRYTTSLTESVDFYLRGEEYSAQMEAFVRRIGNGHVDGKNDFRSAAMTDRTLKALIDDADGMGPQNWGETQPHQLRFRDRLALTSAAGRRAAIARTVRGGAFSRRLLQNAKKRRAV